MITVSNRQKLRRVDTRLLKKIAARTVAALYERRPDKSSAVIDRRYNLSIVLVNDAEIAKLNRQFHDTDGPTDILTFDYDVGRLCESASAPAPPRRGGLQPDDVPSAELIISVETARRQARRYRSPFKRELALYVVHGILHLSGYDDRTPRQRARMRAAERRVLAVAGLQVPGG